MHPDDQSLFITEKLCLNDLMMGLASSFPECLMRSCWLVDSVLQVHYTYFLPQLKKLNRKGMSSVCSTLVNTVVIRRGPGLALERLEITTSLIRSISRLVYVSFVL